MRTKHSLRLAQGGDSAVPPQFALFSRFAGFGRSL